MKTTLRTPRLTLALLGVTLLPLSACSTKSDGSSGGAEKSGSVKTDIGVSDDEIRLGALTDLSSPFKAQGLATTQGNELWAEDVNAAGGICGRKVTIVSKDHGYKADSALSLYEGMKGDVAGFVQIFGTPTFGAVKPKLATDDMLAIPSSLASSLLDMPQVLLVGTTYDIEMINGLGYLQQEGKIADGDTIGHIYVDSEYGKNAQLGVTAYAQAHSLAVESASVTGTDNDMTATITAMKAKGVKAIAITLSPGATASVLLQSAAQGLDVPIVGNTPTWDTTLLTGNPIETFKNYYRVTAQSPFGYAESPAAVKVAKAYKAKFADAPIDVVNFGYASAQVYGEALSIACESGDLTRAGIVKAAAKIKADLGGLTADLDYSTPGAPPTRKVYVEQADAGADGGLKVLKAGYSAPEAAKYRAPFEK